MLKIEFFYENFVFLSFRTPCGSISKVNCLRLNSFTLIIGCVCVSENTGVEMGTGVAASLRGSGLRRVGRVWSRAGVWACGLELLKLRPEFWGACFFIKKISNLKL